MCWSINGLLQCIIYEEQLPKLNNKNWHGTCFTINID